MVIVRMDPHLRMSNYCMFFMVGTSFIMVTTSAKYISKGSRSLYFLMIYIIYVELFSHVRNVEFVYIFLGFGWTHLNKLQRTTLITTWIPYIIALSIRYVKKEKNLEISRRLV